ncbi:MAG: ABC transporter substrate-binding protein [Dysosmobacter sp.]
MMEVRYEKIFLSLLTLTMVLSLAACGDNSSTPSTPGEDGTQSDAANSDTIKIGYVSDLTGATALWGTAGQYGAELAIKQVNENGGVLDGKMLELVPMDGKGEPADSVSAFKNLVRGT